MSISCDFVSVPTLRHLSREKKNATGEWKGATWLVRTEYDATQSEPTSSRPSPLFHFLLRKCCGPCLCSYRENGHWRSIWRRPEEGAHLCHLFGLLQGPRHTQVRPQFLPLLHLPALGRKWRWLRISMSSMPNGNVNFVSVVIARLCFSLFFACLIQRWQSTVIWSELKVTFFIDRRTWRRLLTHFHSSCR